MLSPKSFVFNLDKVGNIFHIWYWQLCWYTFASRMCSKFNIL